MRQLVSWSLIVFLLTLPTASAWRPGSMPHVEPEDPEAQGCFFFWKRFSGLDLLEPVKLQGGYTGPKDPAPWSAYEWTPDNGFMSWFYVFHNGACCAVIINCDDLNARVEFCAQDLQSRWIILGDGWIPWYEACVGL